MAAQALYRKWRPQTFDEVIGQDHVTRTLRNALRGSKVAHAYLFAGPRGTGKTSMARILAKAVNCLFEGDEKPCNQCAICRSITEGRCMDLIEIDAASNRGIDEIRDLREKVNFAPSEAKYKFYVIDECFRYEDLITLADGSKLPIGKIVEAGLHVEVLSYNKRTHRIEPKPVVRHMRKQPELPMVRITFDNNRVLVCTLNHKFYTPNGQMRAGELKGGQFVYAGYERTTEHQLAVIAGAALGDGHIALIDSQMRARLHITQGVAQKDYLDYKMQLLGDLVETPPTHQHSPKSYSRKGTYHLTTVSRPQIAELHRELYDHHGGKRISRVYLDRLTPLGLAIWYLDDGSLITQAHYYTRKDGTVANYPAIRSILNVHGFCLEEAHLIKEWLQEKWGIEGGVSATAKGPVIWLTLEGTERLHEIIAPYVPPNMAYKLLPAYRNKFCPPTDDGTLGGLAVSIVRSIERVTPPEFVYNIEVADNHNYFARDILVANCHMLTNEAFNALLKTLEEPPPHVIFVLATTAPHKIPPTVLSRCQRFDFHRIALEDLERKLTHICQQEGIAIEPAALELIARNATGSFRDAESLLDQLVAYGGGEITLAQVQAILGTVSPQAIEELVGHILARDVKAGLHLINRVIDDGNDPRQFNHELMGYLRGLLLIKTSGDSSLLNVTAEAMAKMAEQAKGFPLEGLIRTIKLFNRASLDLKTGLQPQLPLELAFIEATLPDTAEAGAPPRPSPSTEVSSAQGLTLGYETTTPPPKPSPPPEGESRQSVRADEQPFGLSASADAQRKPLRAKPRAETLREGTSQANLEQVRGSWPEVLASIKPRNRSIEALLKSCEPIAVVGDMVVLGFYYSFHKERIEEPESRAFVERFLSEAMGSTYRIRCVLSPKDRQERYQAVIEDPLVKAAVKMYGAKIVDVQGP